MGSATHILLFAAPVRGNLRGPIPAFSLGVQSSLASHRCAGLRFYEGWDKQEFNLLSSTSTSVECFSNCIGLVADDDDDLPSVDALVASAGVASGAASNGPSHTPAASPIPDDDIYQAQMLAAMQESREMYATAQRNGGSSSSQLPTQNRGSSSTGALGLAIEVTPAPIVQVSTLEAVVSPANLPVPFPPTPLPPTQEVSPVPPPRPTRELVRNPEVIKALFDRLDMALPEASAEIDRLKFTQHGGSVEQAVDALLAFLQDFTARKFDFNIEPIDVDSHWRDVVEIQPDTVAGMMRTTYHTWKLEPAVGPGVMRVVLEAAMKKIFSNAQFFQKNGHTDSYTPVMPVVAEPTSNGVSRELFMATAGVFTALYLAWTRTGPPLLSAIFIQAIINGHESIQEDELLRLYCPNFRGRYLSLLQHPLDLPFEIQDPLYYFLEPALEDQDIRTLGGPPHNGASRTPQYHQGLCRAALSYHLLGNSRQSTFDTHPDILAFKKGLDLPLSEDCTMLQVLKVDSPRHLPALWCRELHSPEVLLEHLKFCTPVDDDYNRRDLNAGEEIIAEAFRDYLRGPGHPVCSLLQNLIPAQEFTEYQGDYGLRSRLFLLATTGSSLVPTEGNWDITVELIPDPGKNPINDTSVIVPKPLEWQLCSQTVRLYYDDDFINACQEPRPAILTSATFSRLIDRWFHYQIIDIKGTNGTEREVPGADWSEPLMDLDPSQESIAETEADSSFEASYPQPSPRMHPLGLFLDDATFEQLEVRGDQEMEGVIDYSDVPPQSTPALPPMSSEDATAMTLSDLLMRDYGEQWNLYNTQGFSQSLSGHHAILGARLYEQIAQRFAIRARGTGVWEGIEFSMDDIAAWLQQSPNTIANWRTAERRR
ncbi:hypothetical protein FRC11_006346, partial [Ceratobasidium sp. 423]